MNTLPMIEFRPLNNLSVYLDRLVSHPYCKVPEYRLMVSLFSWALIGF